MILNLSGGAGAVVAITASLSEPAPSEGLVWVKSATPVNGWVFASAQPDGTDGRVWVVTGAASDVAFNAAVGNALMVYPQICYQYIGGEWSFVPAYTYKDGSWAEWTTLDFATNWINDTAAFAALSTGLEQLNETFGALPITFTVERLPSGRPALMRTDRPIDLTNVDKLRLVTGSRHYGHSLIAVTRKPADELFTGSASTTTAGLLAASLWRPFAEVVFTGLDPAGAYEIDVSSVTGSCYVYLGLLAFSDGNYILKVNSFDRVYKDGGQA